MMIPIKLWVKLPWRIKRLGIQMKGDNLDPLTAIFQFLNSPGGQKIVLGIEDIIQDLIKLFHHQSGAANIPVTPVTPK